MCDMDLEDVIAIIEGRIEAARREDEAIELGELRTAEVGSVGLVDLVNGALGVEVLVGVGDNELRGVPVRVGADWFEISGTRQCALIRLAAVEWIEGLGRAGNARSRLELKLPAILRRDVGVSVRIVGPGVDAVGEIADVGADWVRIVSGALDWSGSVRDDRVIPFSAIGYVEFLR